MTEPAIKTATPLFDGGFFDGLEDLIRWRRDVRRFRSEPVDGRLIDELIGLAALAPSVGKRGTTGSAVSHTVGVRLSGWTIALKLVQLPP